MAKDMVVDAPDRLYPVTLVVLPEGTEPALEEEASPCARGHAFTVGCSVLGKGDGKVVLTSFAEGEELMGGVRSALAWARLHCSALARVFRGRQELTNLRRTDLDYWMDFGLEYITKTGASVSKPPFVTQLQLAVLCSRAADVEVLCMSCVDLVVRSAWRGGGLLVRDDGV